MEQRENIYRGLCLSPQWTFCHTPKAQLNTIRLGVLSGDRVSDLVSQGLEDCDLGELV